MDERAALVIGAKLARRHDVQSAGGAHGARHPFARFRHVLLQGDFVSTPSEGTLVLEHDAPHHDHHEQGQEHGDGQFNQGDARVAPPLARGLVTAIPMEGQRLAAQIQAARDRVMVVRHERSFPVQIPTE